MRMKDVGFYKLCGSGTGQGFTPRPNRQVWAILATWPDQDTARRNLTESAVYRRWQANSSENWTILLSPTSSRGQWSGQTPFSPAPPTPALPENAPPVSGNPVSGTPVSGTPVPGPPVPGPIVALTRATMRLSTFARFWARVPDISAVIGQDPNVIFKIGIGEVPLLHQVTFSIWPDAASMAHFARGNGPHGRAIQAVRAEGWFAEELYARFSILEDWGTWGGKRPLAGTLNA